MGDNQPSVRQLIVREQAGEDPGDLLREAVGPEEAEHVRDALRRLGDAITPFVKWLRSGDPAADWCIVLLPHTPTEDQRLAALRRILSRMKGPPIHPARWRANRVALVSACEDLGVRVDELAEARGWEAVGQAVGGLTPAEVQKGPKGAMKGFWSALQRLICDDLLPGHDWKHSRRRQVATPEEAPPSALLHEDERYAAVRARAEVDALLDRAGLTDYQAEVLALERDGLTTAEIAAALDRSESAVRRARSDALAKVRQATP